MDIIKRWKGEMIQEDHQVKMGEKKINVGKKNTRKIVAAFTSLALKEKIFPFVPSFLLLFL